MEGFEKFEIFSHYESVNLTLNRQKGSECALYLRTASTHQGWGGGGVVGEGGLQKIQTGYVFTGAREFPKRISLCYWTEKFLGKKIFLFDKKSF